MKNAEIVDAFVQILLQDPELAIQAVQMRLGNTRYEIRLLKAEPFKEYDAKEDHIYQWPVNTGERGTAVL